VDEPRWTLDELAQRARQLLAADDVRAPNGRVRELGDDGRAIRWYSTKGLVDRPTIGAGHAARYGRRHLLQLVAVKRLQARGMTLAEIQRQLAGATDAMLREVAGLPETPDMPETPDHLEQSAPVRHSRFWAAAPMAATVETPEPAAPMATSAADDTITEIRYVVALSDSAAVTLSLPAKPDAADLAAIRVAAAPLLELLASRGLTATEGD